MKNLNNEIFSATYITYKSIGKKNEGTGTGATGLKQKTRIANEDVRLRWKTKTGIRIWVSELKLRREKIHKLKFKHWKQKQLYSDRARAKALSW